MKYSVLFGHLAEESPLIVGASVCEGDYIGEMGNTGISTGAHLHLGLKAGHYPRIFRMSEVSVTRSLLRQIARFKSLELFRTEAEITSYFMDPDYKGKDGKLVDHTGLDLIPKNKAKENFGIHWPLPEIGITLAKGTGDAGYGNWAVVVYNGGINGE